MPTQSVQTTALAAESATLRTTAASATTAGSRLTARLQLANQIAMRTANAVLMVSASAGRDGQERRAINSLAPRTADLTGHVPLAAVCALMAGPEKAARRRWRCAPTPTTAASRRAGVHQTVRAASARRDGSARRVASRPSALLTTVARATVSASKVVVRASRVGAVTTVGGLCVPQQPTRAFSALGEESASTAHVSASMATPARRAKFTSDVLAGAAGTASAVQRSASATPDGRALNARTALVRVAAMAAAGARMASAYVSRGGWA